MAIYTTDVYEGMLAETITIQGHGGDAINAYLARPLGTGPFSGVVLIHHAPVGMSCTGSLLGSSPIMDTLQSVQICTFEPDMGYPRT